VFATRAPVRPNLIGLTLCRIRSVSGNTVIVEGLDAFDCTPVLDLKPFAPGIDLPSVKTPDWASGSPAKPRAGGITKAIQR